MIGIIISANNTCVFLSVVDGYLRHNDVREESQMCYIRCMLSCRNSLQLMFHAFIAITSVLVCASTVLAQEYSNNWVQLTPATAPTARAKHAMAFDEANGEVVLFCGLSDTSDRTTVLGDTWVWDTNGRRSSLQILPLPGIDKEFFMFLNDLWNYPTRVI